MRAHTAPTTQIQRTRPGEPRSPARNPVVPKMPVPIMLDTTSAVALTTPSCRRRAGFEFGEVTSVFILLRTCHIAGTYKRRAAIAEIDTACHVGGCVRGKEQCEIGQLVFGAEAPQRNRRPTARADFSRWSQPPHPFRVVRRPGRNAVTADAGRTPLNRQRLDEQIHAGLARADVRLVRGQ